MRRLAVYLERRWLARHWRHAGVVPWWSGPVGWRWRIVMALRALAGDELRGWK